MTKLEIIVRPEKLDDLKAALEDLGHTGMTVSHVLGCGRQAGLTPRFRGMEYQSRFVRKIKVEIALPTPMVEEAIWAIRNTCCTGEVGDGKIFVFDLPGAIRIRTGEVGNVAL